MVAILETPQYVAYQKNVVYSFLKLSAKSHSFNILRTMDGLSCPTSEYNFGFVTHTDIQNKTKKKKKKPNNNNKQTKQKTNKQKRKTSTYNPTTNKSIQKVMWKWISMNMEHGMRKNGIKQIY